MSLAASGGFKIKAASYTIRPFPVSLLYSLPKKIMHRSKNIWHNRYCCDHRSRGGAMILWWSWPRLSLQSPVTELWPAQPPAAGAQFLSDHNISSIYLVIIHLATLSFNCSWKCPVIGVCVSVVTWWRHSITRQFVSDGWWLCHKTRWNPTTLAAASCWCDALIVKLSPQQFQSSTETSS